MKKKLLFCIILLVGLTKANAQVKLRIEPGILLGTDSDNLGLLFNVEPKIKSSENTIIGLRFGLSVNSQKFNINDTARFFIDNENDNAVISFTPTFDYYFTENFNRPYIGLGLGYYILSTIDVSDLSNTSEIQEGNINNQLGFLLRGGLELGNTRFGLEYNLIPSSDIEMPSDEIIGTVNNSYFGLSIGFTIAGRRNLEE